MDPTRQVPTDDEELSGLPDDPDDDWDRLEQAQDDAYLDQGEPAGRPADEGYEEEPTAVSPEDFDFASMRPAERVATMREITGNPDLPERTALALADGYMRNKHYTEGRQEIQAERRAMQSLLRQHGIEVPDMGSLLGGEAAPGFAPIPQPMMPQMPQQPQTPAGPPEPSDVYDTMGFLNWWRANHGGADPDPTDYQRWKDNKLIGPMVQQVAQDRTRSQVQELRNEWAEVQRQFSHAAEPGVEERVQSILLARLQAGHQPYPGMVREIYLGQFGQQALSPQAQRAPSRQPQPRRQPPPVPPAGRGSASPQQRPHLTTDEAVMEAQLSNEALLRELEGSLTSDVNVYEQPTMRRRR